MFLGHWTPGTTELSIMTDAQHSKVMMVADQANALGMSPCVGA